MILTYCSRCIDQTNWKEHSEYWQCQECERKTYKRTYDECQKEFEEIQERWSALEKSIPTDHFLSKPENKEITESIMTNLDQKVYHLRIINQDTT